MESQTIKSNQINLKISNKLLEEAQNYSLEFGYSNIQELIRESIREKVIKRKVNPEYLRMLLTDTECHEGIGVDKSIKLLKELQNKNARY